MHEYKLEYTEAKQCYQNAVSINPSHIKSLQHLVIIVTLHALIFMTLHKFHILVQYWIKIYKSNIISISDYLQGLIYHYLGSQRLAEKTLRDAAKIDPNSHQTWYYINYLS